MCTYEIKVFELYTEYFYYSLGIFIVHIKEANAFKLGKVLKCCVTLKRIVLIKFSCEISTKLIFTYKFIFKGKLEYCSIVSEIYPGN